MEAVLYSTGKLEMLFSVCVSECGMVNTCLSVFQGENPTKWRTTPFRMFRGGSLWKPPILTPYLHGDEDAEESSFPVQEEEPKKGQLKTE